MDVTTKMISITSLILILMLTGCSVNNDYDEMNDTYVEVVDSISENLLDDQKELNDDLKNYEEVWQRTGVASY